MAGIPAHGSAPQVRGTGNVRRWGTTQGRFSPAGAGNGLVSIPLMLLAFYDVNERTNMNNNFITLLHAGVSHWI